MREGQDDLIRAGTVEELQPKGRVVVRGRRCPILVVHDQGRVFAIQPPSGGDPVLPSVDAARNGSYQPLSRPVFIYVSKQAADELEGVRQFVEFYLDPENAEALVTEVGYLPLPTDAYELALQIFQETAHGHCVRRRLAGRRRGRGSAPSAEDQLNLPPQGRRKGQCPSALSRRLGPSLR
jgi:hypothetical protein